MTRLQVRPARECCVRPAGVNSLQCMRALCLVAAGLAGGARADTVQARCHIYPKGSDKASAKLACSFSQQQGHLRIQRSDGVAYELRPVGDSPGRHVDAQGRPAVRNSGLGKGGQIYRFANQSVFVYWETAGLPGTASSAAATARPTALPPSPAQQVPLSRSLNLQGARVQLSSANDASLNELKIVLAGLSRDNTAIVRSIDGQVGGAEMADLDADGSPELYVYVVSAGSGSYGSLVAYAANRRRSISEITLPPLADTPSADKGYMGHDQFAVVENSLARRFPVYRDGDTHAASSGGVRQLQYKLKRGEAGWRLVVDRVVEY
jgi:hypothetical protein